MEWMDIPTASRESFERAMAGAMSDWRARTVKRLPGCDVKSSCDVKTGIVRLEAFMPNHCGLSAIVVTETWTVSQFLEAWARRHLVP